MGAKLADEESVISRLLTFPRAVWCGESGGERRDSPCPGAVSILQ